MKQVISAFCVLFFAGWVSCLAQDDMKAFPAAEPGVVRYVWNAPSLENESEARVEIVIGKMAEVDDRNHYFLAGSIKEETIKGWGYNRYVVKSNGAIVGTLMAVPPGTPKVSKFIILGGEPKLYRYNSKLPVVVYVPEGLTVKFRVWKPSDETIDGKAG